MEKESHKNLGRIMLILVIIMSIFKIVISFENSNFIIRGNNLDLFTNMLYLLVCIISIFTGFRDKKRHPYFSKCLGVSGIIGAIIILTFEIIPRVI